MTREAATGEAANGETAQASATLDIGPAETPPIDLEHLRAWSNGDEQFVRELIDLYLEQTIGQLTLLRTAHAARSAADVEHVAHSCKGASGTFGAVRLAPLFFRLELAGREQRLDQAAPLIAEIEREFARLNSFLQQSLTAGSMMESQA